MALPDFLLVGAPKAGSTALHAALVGHPQLYLSDPKEPKFFLTDGRRPRRSEQRGPGDAHSAQEWVWRRDRYEALFAGAPPGTLAGESTPFYLWDAESHRRMARLVPAARLIAVIRDPVDRAYSNWTHLRADGLEPEADFLRACDLEAQRAERGWAPFWRYQGLGRYGEQLAHLFEHFPREQVAVVRYRELIDSPAETLDRLTGFLGVDRGVVTAIPGSNVSSWAADGVVNAGLRRAVRAGAALGSLAPPAVWRQASRPLLAALHRGPGARPSLDVAVRRELVGRFADDIALLEELLGNSYQDWLGDSGRGTYAVRRSLAPSERDASQ
ncbi:Sulfotransferase family protein [Jatrophihabitans endophyticus]|uniref:Sulfotransferase family protein n=1 Tax=Jatrophihabitans endophyticus TaxID=1206085 RepID=A0A1M5K5B1_9ACTN|nr:sulfotransferase [Jatrophihabitans endophyticus]SHG47975.1 Sulfotransferase family protein [Jatrophihabitans endophyticus]